MMTVQQLMTDADTVVDPQAPLSTILARMQRWRRSCALIVADGQLRGIVTERDLTAVMLHALEKGWLDNPPVEAVMTPEPVCVRPDTPLLEALKLARDHRTRHFPVLDEAHRLLGIVTQTDMANAYIDLLESHAQLLRTNRALRAASLRDPLLRVGNRRAMDRDLTGLVGCEEPFAVALLDLDRFKSYNDRFGHPAGDRALRAVAKAVQANLRGGDSLYRYGGEELLLLMPGADLEGGREGADRARRAVEALELVHPDSSSGHLTLSGGVAAGRGARVRSLVEDADQALYRAKHAGRNRIIQAEPVPAPAEVAGAGA